MTEEILNAINGEVYGVWFLIGAALVFWMQAGFAMVETGFTRAKNAGNILMKNLMDFLKICSFCLPKNVHSSSFADSRNHRLLPVDLHNPPLHRYNIQTHEALHALHLLKIPSHPGVLHSQISFYVCPRPKVQPEQGAVQTKAGMPKAAFYLFSSCHLSVLYTVHVFIPAKLRAVKCDL